MRLSASRERIFGLDLMRALAIVLVFVGHCLWIYPNANPLMVSAFQVFAFLGVEVFFVLSGFLIGGILYRLYIEDDFKMKSVLFFLRRRWFRTLPAYYLVLLINIVITAYYGSVEANGWKYVLFLQNFNTAMPAFFPESWSLSVEEYSYLILPFSLFIFGTLFKPVNRSRFFLLLVCALILTSILAKLHFCNSSHHTDISQWNASLKSVVIYRLDAIFIGVAFSWFAQNYQSLWIRYRKISALTGCLYIGFLFVGVGYFRLLIDTQPFFWNVLYLPLVSMAIALFLPILSEWKMWELRFSKPITFISIISYSIYLLHYSVILQLMKNSFQTENTTGMQFHSFTIAYISVTLIMSYLLYRFFEKPIMDFRDK